MKYICFFDEPRAMQPALVGGKGINLAKMAAAGFPVPPGFCITSEANRYLVEMTGLNPVIAGKLARLDFSDPAAVAGTAACIRELINQQPMPIVIAQEIEAGYEQLGNRIGIRGLPVAVSASAAAEDLEDISFSGQEDTFLNVRGHIAVLEHVRRCWASLWTNQALAYRHKQGVGHQQAYLAVVVQPAIVPDTFGIDFTANPINASWGLSKAIFSGVISPDTDAVTKLDGRIIKKYIVSKNWMKNRGA